MAEELTEPATAMGAPRRGPSSWAGFVHLLARFRMNYRAAVMKAARRKKHRSADVDEQPSKQGTPWALHWGTLGKNKLHDPTGHYGRKTRIDKLSDAELGRMKYSNGAHPDKLVTILELAAKHGVRVEVETKHYTTLQQWLLLIHPPAVHAMLKRGDLQVKTLAGMMGAVGRLTTAHKAGIPTILSFTKYHGRGIPKKQAWPVTDYVRGRAKWI